MLPAARAAFERVGGATVLATQRAGDEARCAQEALARGATRVVVLGGDGTISQVACELVRQRARVPLAALRAGTGNDFVKSLGLPSHDFPEMARLVALGASRSVDAARIDSTVFVNVAGFGFDTEVLARTLEPGAKRGNAVYLATAAKQLFRYGGFDAEVVGESDRRRWLTLVFANARWFGGGFHIAPRASIADGLVDGVFIGNAPPVRRALLFARATRGAHLGAPEVGHVQRSRFAVRFDSPPLFQADGELRQAEDATVEIECLPNAFDVVTDAPV